jgi:energy-converting hydrogenase Eha subunit G
VVDAAKIKTMKGEKDVRRISTLALIAILICLGLLFLGFTGGAGSGLGMEHRARQALEAQGYTNAQYTGYEFWACGKDAQGWNYTATNPAGVTVNATACTENGLFGVNKSWWIVTR